MSTAVNRPTNVKQKEKDIDQKLQLYGIYEAFSHGKVPSNKQIDVALNSALASKPLASPSPKLSEEGRKLVADLREVVEQAKLLLLSKNEGNLLQDFVWQCQQISGGDVKGPNAPVDKDTAKQHGNEALDGLRTLGTLLLSNGQFRKLLSDATVLVRDMAGDGAQKAATKINPSDEKLAQIDHPAEDNTWHDVPSVSELKARAKDTVDKNAPFSKKDVQDATDKANAQGDNQGAAAAAASHLVETGKQNIPQEKVDQAKDLKENSRLKAKNYLNEKIPQERRDQTIWRLKKMVVEIQGHEDYTQAIETLLTLAETYGAHGKNLSAQSAGTVKGAHTDDSLNAAEADLKTLIERFANSTSSDDLFDAINTIYNDAQKDPELRQWFKDVDTYIRKCLQQQGYIIQDASTEEGRGLYDRGQFLLRERYRDHTNRILDEIKYFGQQFDEDPQNKAFAAATQKLFLDLGNDSDGKPTFKAHLVKDLTNVIVPGFFEEVQYVPIPRIEYSDPQFDAIIENLVVESDNLFPNSLEIASDNYFKWGRKSVASRNKNKVMIAGSGVQMDLRDVSYYINKKEGFPSIKDKGIMDIFMGGSGFGFKLALETADRSDRAHFFKVTSVKVDIQNLKLKMKKSNHKILFNLFKPLLLSVVKPVLTKVIEKVIKDNFQKGDAWAYAVHQQANIALEEAKNDPENAPNVWARYSTAAQRKIAEGKQTAAAKTDAAKKNVSTNLAMTQQDSIFKDIKLPGGISTKATEYKAQAAKGEKWESPVFGIGAAAESRNIPKVAAVTRKPHAATTPQLRGTSGADGNGKFTTNGNAPTQIGGTTTY